MHDETIHQAAVVGAVGAGEVVGPGGVMPSVAAGGEAKAGGEGQASEGMAVAGRPEGGEVNGGGEEGEGAGQGGATGVHFGLRESRQSYLAVKPAIASVAQGDLSTARVDPQKVAVVVISLLWRDSRPDRRKEFERFAAQGNYDITLLDRLPRYGRAVWYLRRQQQLALAVTSGAVVSEDERRKAFELRAHLMSELEYHCDDMPEVVAKLAHLREGSGHQDMVNDLETLVDIAQRPEVRARLETSRKFRPDATVEALRLAEVLLQPMGMGEEGEAEQLTGQLQRAMTLTLRGYEEHAIAGRFLFRKVEDVEATYPSLYTAARSPRRKRQADGSSGGGSGGEGPGDDGAGGDEPGDDGSGPALYPPSVMRP